MFFFSIHPKNVYRKSNQKRKKKGKVIKIKTKKKGKQSQPTAKTAD